MIRIITDPVLHSAILIGVYHPLNQYSRQCLLNYIALSVKALTDAQHPSRPALTDSIDANKVTTEDLESMQHIEVSNDGSSKTPVLRLSTVGSAIEDNNQEPDCAKADSNMENIVYNLLNKVEDLVSGSVVHEIISKLLDKVEDLVISDESNNIGDGAGDPNLHASIGSEDNTVEDNADEEKVDLSAVLPEKNEVGICDPDPVAIVVHDVAAADKDGDADQHLQIFS